MHKQEAAADLYRIRPEGIRVRVVAEDKPGDDAQAVNPGLEDAYTWLLGADAAAH